MGNFQSLRVWQLAKELTIQIYSLTQSTDFKRDFGLRDQIRRASVSIPANIAEGDELGTNKQSIRHFYIAKGSTAEVQTLLIISREIGYLNEQEQKLLHNDYNKISIMLHKLISIRSGNKSPDSKD
jgi:four helix bundle protein